MGGASIEAGAAGAGPGGRYRRDIDGLRAVAILAVVLFHGDVPFLGGGFVGVDVFFVISGFLIAGIIKGELEAGTFSLAGFYERRARRILPALVVMVTAALIAGWAILLPDAFRSFAASAIAALFSVSNFWFWRESNDYFAGNADSMPLLHTWSLGVEDQFYLLVPLLILLAFRWRRWLLPAAATVAVLVLLALGAFAATARPAAAFYLVPFRAWELGIGVLLAVVPLPPLRARGLREVFAAGGIAAIAAACLLYSEDTLFPGTGALLPTLGAAAVIYTGISGSSITGRILSLGPMVFVGLISYSLYLWHWPILVFLQLLLGGAELTGTQKALALAASFPIAWLSFRFVEQPFRKRRWLSRRQVLWSSVASVGAVASAAAIVIAADGVRARFSPAEQPLVAYLERTANNHRCLQNAFTDPECSLGIDGAVPTMLLWGDSHAGAIAPAVDLAATAAGVAGVKAWSSSCPPLVGVVRTREDCPGFNKFILAELRNHPAIDTVILDGRWALWERNNHRRTDDLPPIPDLLDDPDLPGAFGAEGALAFGLDQLFDVLLAEGYSVVLIGTTPEFPFSVPEALLAELRWGIDVDATDMPAYLERNQQVIPMFEAFDARPGIHFVPVVDVLCPDECILEIEGNPVYRDADHLSRFGAEALLADVLAERIWGVSPN